MEYIDNTSRKIDAECEWRDLAARLKISRARLQSLAGRRKDEHQEKVSAKILKDWFKKSSPKEDKV